MMKYGLELCFISERNCKMLLIKIVYGKVLTLCRLLDKNMDLNTINKVTDTILDASKEGDLL
jgi:hypothetical protein